MTPLRRLVALLRPHAGRLTLASFCMLGVAVFTVQLAALIRPLFDRFLIPAGTLTSVRGLPVLLVGFYLGKGACAYQATAIMGRVGQEVISDLRSRVHESALAWPLGRFVQGRSGDLLSRALVDVDRLETAVSEKIGALARESLVVLALAGWLLYLDPLLAVGSLLAAPLVAGSLVLFGRRVRRETRAAQREMGWISTIFQESVAGIRVVKAFGMEAFESGRLRDAAARLVRANLAAIRVSAFTPPLMEVVGGVAAAVVFVYGSGRIAAGEMSVGGFTSFLTTLLLMYTPVKKISNANNFLQGSLASAERVFEVLDAEVEVVGRGTAALEAPRREVRFEGVSFRYEDDWVLRDLDLTLPAGRVVAVVGASGAGKSTLANLLLRFYKPQGGRILWDGADLQEASLQILREQIALVTQETILFHDTVARNIAYGRDDRSRREIIEAARTANADGFIQALPRGYDTIIGERGERLSVGQRQRLAIARALLKGAPVLILDEATSSLDVETEGEVQTALERLMAGRTVLMIAHRLTTVRRADQIVVLQNGRVAEAGDHRELLVRRGTYARMYERFAEGGGVDGR